MQVLNGVTAQANYTPAATIAYVYNSSGGYFLVTSNPAFAQIAFARQGLEQWTREIHVPVGAGVLFPGTIGVRFRNYGTGGPAVVTAVLSEHGEPAVALAPAGTLP